MSIVSFPSTGQERQEYNSYPSTQRYRNFRSSEVPNAIMVCDGVRCVIVPCQFACRSLCLCLCRVYQLLAGIGNSTCSSLSLSRVSIPRSLVLARLWMNRLQYALESHGPSSTYSFTHSFFLPSFFIVIIYCFRRPLLSIPNPFCWI